MSAKCGVPRRQANGAPCKKSAGWGTDHNGTGPCRLHGGNFPSVATAAERARAHSELQAVLAGLGQAEPVENPLLALQELAAEALQFRNALRAMVQRLNSLRYDGQAGEQVRGEVLLYERALDRAGKVLADIARLRIDERLAAISQQQTDTIIEAINAALNAAGVVDIGARNTARRAAAAHLSSISGG